MKAVDILETDFLRLKQLAEPFVDTPASVISRLLDAYEGKNPPTIEPDKHEKSPPCLEFSPTELPDFTHTKLLMASFGGVQAADSKWDALLKVALNQIFKKYGNTGEVRRISGANIFDGVKTDEGYKPIEPLPFSYQGQSASDIANCVIRSAKALQVPLSIEFEWRNKEAAQHPGQRGRLVLK